MTQRYMHLSPAALDAAIRLLDGAEDEGFGVRAVKNFGDVVETATEEQKRSIKPGMELAVRQGFEPWVGF
jgi:hypothetical protein